MLQRIISSKLTHSGLALTTEVIHPSAAILFRYRSNGSRDSAVSNISKWRHARTFESDFRFSLWRHLFTAIPAVLKRNQRRYHVKKEHLECIEQDSRWAQSQSECFEEREYLLLQPGIEPRVVLWWRCWLGWHRPAKWPKLYVFTNNLEATPMRRQHQIIQNNGSSNSNVQMWESTLKWSEAEKGSGRDEIPEKLGRIQIKLFET
jgi:hypothetical protein